MNASGQWRCTTDTGRQRWRWFCACWYVALSYGRPLCVTARWLAGWLTGKPSTSIVVCRLSCVPGACKWSRRNREHQSRVNEVNRLVCKLRELRPAHLKVAAMVSVAWEFMSILMVRKQSTRQSRMSNSISLLAFRLLEQRLNLQFVRFIDKLSVVKRRQRASLITGPTKRWLIDHFGSVCSTKTAPGKRDFASRHTSDTSHHSVWTSSVWTFGCLARNLDAVTCLLAC